MVEEVVVVVCDDCVRSDDANDSAFVNEVDRPGAVVVVETNNGNNVSRRSETIAHSVAHRAR